MRSVDASPLLAAVRAGRPRHTDGCPHCHGRQGVAGWAGRAVRGDWTMDPSDRIGFSALCVTDQEVAEVLGTNRWQVLRWSNGLGVDARDLDRLDRLAVAAGSHPLTLWPELFETWAA